MPDWVHLLHSLGFAVDLATDRTAGHLETHKTLPRRVAWRDLQKLTAEHARAYDFVFLGTLVHEDYGLDLGATPAPTMELLHSLGRPSVSIIHEPDMWERRVAVDTYDVHYPDDDAHYPSGQRFLALLDDGAFFMPGDPWVDDTWRWQGDQLWVPMKDRPRTFIDTSNNQAGETLRAIGDGVILRRRPEANRDLETFTSSGRHRVLTLTDAGRRMLLPTCSTADWLVPVMPRIPRPLPAGEPKIVFAGQVDYGRKAMSSLVAAAPLPNGERILLLGGSRKGHLDASPDGQRLRWELQQRGTESSFVWTGYLPYYEFLGRFSHSQFVVPLIDPHVDNGSYMNKLPAIIPLCLAHGIPIILEETMAKHYGIDCAITYPGDELGPALRRAVVLNTGEISALRYRTHAVASSTRARALRVLSGCIETMLAAERAT